MRIILVSSMLISALAINVSAQVAKLYPVDEASKEPTFFTFRARLIQAVQRRDTGYLLSILSPNDIVEVSDWGGNKARGEKRDWIKVKLSDGQSGYVAQEFIRSPIAYRAAFAKEEGRWLMTYFIAGD